MCIYKNIIYISFTLILTACSISPIQSENMDTGSEERVYTIEYGFLDEKNNHIDNGETLIPNNGQIQGTVTIGHNVPEERKYKIIILDNYKQTTFQIDNETELVESYSFAMEADSAKKINITVPVNQSTQELSILTIKKPDYLLKEFDLNRANILEEVLAYRLPVQNKNTSPEITFLAPDYAFEDGPNDYMVASTELENLKVTLQQESGSKIYLSAGNMEPEGDIPYVIVALKDWKQHKINSNNEIIFTKVPADSRHVFEFFLPEAEFEQNFQYLAFPYPFEAEKDNYNSQTVFGSFRIVLKP